MLNAVCVANEIKGDISRDILNNYDGELLLEVSKRFARYARDTMGFDVDTGEVQDFQKLVDKIIGCCEENDWFQKE